MSAISTNKVRQQRVAATEVRSLRRFASVDAVAARRNSVGGPQRFFSNWWPNFKLTAPDPPSEGPRESRSPIDGAALRAWLVAALAKPGELDAAGAVTFATDQDAVGMISLRTIEGRRQQALEIRDAVLDELDLSDLDEPNLVVLISDSVVDVVDISRSTLSEVELWDLSPSGPWFGVVVAATNCRLKGTLRIQGRSRPSELPSGSTKNEYISLDADCLSAQQVILWNISFTGPKWLSRFHYAKQREAYNELYSRFSRSLLLTEARLSTFIAYRVEFSGGLTSLRHAVVTSRVKFEECLFSAAYLPQSFDLKHRGRPLMDQFDHDDLRSLNGMVLDLSRAKLGGELIFRRIDSDSSGWMNWAHAETDLLNDDTTLWDGTQIANWSATLRWLGDAPPRMRFRLNGFRYRALSVGRVGRMSDRLLPAERSSNREKRHDDLVRDARDRTKPQPRDRPVDEGRERVEWLCCQMPEDLAYHFMAQPWTEAARVFRERGDYYEANRILHMREKYWHWSLLSNMFQGDFVSVETWRKVGLFIFHLLFSRLAGFGYLIEIPIVLFAAAVLGWSAYYQQQFDAGLLMRNPEATRTKQNGDHTETAAASRESTQDAWAWVIGVAHADGRRQCAEPQACPPCAPTKAACPIAQPNQGAGSGSVADAGTPATKDNSQTTVKNPTEAVAVDKAAAPPRKEDEDYPTFNALAYSFDIMLPAIDISQGTYWIPGYRDANNIDDDPRSKFQAGPKLAEVWKWYWVQIGLGWYLSIVIGLAATGLLERRTSR